MSSPAEHYHEAERLITRASECVVASITRELILQAQVHATLATCVGPYDVYADDEVAWEPSRGMITAETTGDRL